MEIKNLVWNELLNSYTWATNKKDKISETHFMSNVEVHADKEVIVYWEPKSIDYHE